MLSNFRGCLFGLAIGDALGRIVEGMSYEEIKNRYGFIDDYLSEEVEWTDDTEQALLLAESIASTIYFSPEDFANRLKKLSPSKFYGPTSSEAIKRLKMGYSWRESGVPSDTDGAAMRVASIGLVYHFNYNLVEDYAVISSMITHKGSAAIGGAVAVAIAIACVINEDDRMLEEIIKRTEKYDSLISEKIEYAYQIRNASLEKAVKSLGNSIMAFDAVPLAFYCYFSSKTFEKAVTKAVNAGGDTDTIAAIAGAIKGTEVGEEKIPEKFKRIKNQEKIIEAADKLYQVYLKILSNLSSF